ncbi:lysophospholipid acyltransferase family protein [Hirschia litorea]|uniref:Lysophospholipid acyltransferase family protein n=1 Tax=Hirschia litorea TaxID=1199156 RepID=A0ABW2IJP3_9PROT
MMKSIFRSAFLQTILGWMLWAYMALMVRTSRWQIEGEDVLKDHFENNKGAILAAWHARIFVMSVLPAKITSRWKTAENPISMIISQSRDGAFITQAAVHLNLNPIRGSAANKKKKDKDKGGTEALRLATKALKKGGIVCMTPDGPRGPREEAGLGPIRIAQLTNTPIILWGVSAAPSKRMKTWDRLVLPGLFSKGAVVFAGPMEVPRSGDAEQLRLELETRLRDVTRRADELAGLDVLPYPEKTHEPSSQATAHNASAD